MHSRPHIAAKRGVSSGDEVRSTCARQPEIVPGHVGDHPLVHNLLRAVNQAPSPEDFASGLDEPSYEPSDRLLARQNGVVVAHVQILFRRAWFGGVQLPVGGVRDLVALPEYRLGDCESHLLAAAERAMREEGAIVGLVRTDNPDLFARSGWTPARSQGSSRANTRDILSYLTAQAAVRRPRSSRLNVRLWRHVELDALRPVQRLCVRTGWGALHRSEPYWRWLLGRTAHDELIVATVGHPDRPSELADADVQPDNPVADVAAGLKSHSPSSGEGYVTQIVGYAVTQGPHVVELHCLPGHEMAGPLLLARACQDAIEQDYHTLSLHTVASDVLHELLVTAGGRWCNSQSERGSVLMCKLLDPVRWIEAMYPRFHARAKRAGVARPCEIGFAVGQQRYRFRLTRRSSRIINDESVAEDVYCNERIFSSMLIGNDSVEGALQRGELDVSQVDAVATLAALFPPQIAWQSSFDLLRM